jgi:hypothetical protein
MSAIVSTSIDAAAKNSTTSGRLFFLDLSGGRVLSANPDGSDLKTIINEGRKLPDGLVLDVAAGHLYWTNMGDPKRTDGSIMRSNLNSKNMITIVPESKVQKKAEIDGPVRGQNVSAGLRLESSELRRGTFALVRMRSTNICCIRPRIRAFGSIGAEVQVDGAPSIFHMHASV